jgi:hypothetical protein
MCGIPLSLYAALSLSLSRIPIVRYGMTPFFGGSFETYFSIDTEEGKKKKKKKGGGAAVKEFFFNFFFFFFQGI